jgi:hypothetical protein
MVVVPGTLPGWRESWGVGSLSSLHPIAQPASWLPAGKARQFSARPPVLTSAEQLLSKVESHSHWVLAAMPHRSTRALSNTAVMREDFRLQSVCVRQHWCPVPGGPHSWLCATCITGQCQGTVGWGGIQLYGLSDSPSLHSQQCHALPAPQSLVLAWPWAWPSLCFSPSWQAFLELSLWGTSTVSHNCKNSLCCILNVYITSDSWL